MRFSCQEEYEMAMNRFATPTVVPVQAYVFSVSDSNGEEVEVEVL